NPLSRITQRVLTTYSQYHNRKYKKVGHLFEGRCKAILCQTDRYLGELVRYIHLNPVRAKMCVDRRTMSTAAIEPIWAWIDQGLWTQSRCCDISAQLRGARLRSSLVSLRRELMGAGRTTTIGRRKGSSWEARSFWSS